VRSAVQAHVEGCPTCPALVAALVGATSALGQVRDPDTVVAPDLAARIRAQLSPEPTAPASAPPD
jgi:hypothetical protein